MADQASTVEQSGGGAVSKAPTWLIAAALGAVPAIALVQGYVSIPRPTSLSQARANVDRAALKGIALESVPSDATALNIPLDGKATIVGARVPSAVKVGEALEVTVFFRAESELDRDWEVFVHGDRQGGGHRMHGDHAPARGKHPTSMWQKGGIVADTFRVSTSSAQSGTYDMWVGLYIGNERLRVRLPRGAHHDGDNRARVGSVELR